MNRFLETSIRGLEGVGRMSRQAWGYVLFYGAVISIGGAFLLDRFGLRSPSLGPVAFVSAIACIMLGLFAFWPVIRQKGREASVVVGEIFPKEARKETPDARPRRKTDGALTLWTGADSRIDMSLFQSNVPTFVLNHEQRFLDWNVAFDMVFGGAAGVEKNAHVTAWFEHLENYKRVSKRQEKLYGEGILPLADRERATYMHAQYGRMVFTKIMTPIIDRRTGKVLGWNVVLNVNSVNKREEFFEDLYAELAKETRRIRHAAAVPGLFRQYKPFRELLARHEAVVLSNLTNEKAPRPRILELGAGAGLLSKKLLARGARLTVVETETELLRQLKVRCAEHDARLSIVRQDLDSLRDVPAERFDACSVSFSAHRIQNMDAAAATVFEALKPGGSLVVSGLLKGTTTQSLFDGLNTSLMASGGFEHVKHQFNHVLETELEFEAAGPYQTRSLEDVKASLARAGFDLKSESESMLDGQAYFLIAQKP